MIATSNVALTRGLNGARYGLRLLAMLKIIPRQPPGITGRDLRKKLGKRGYEVSKRMVERDLVRSVHEAICDNREDSFTVFAEERWPLAHFDGYHDALAYLSQ